MSRPVHVLGNHLPGVVLTGVLACFILLGCSRYSGPLIKNQGEAFDVVVSYRPGQLTEARFLEEWPMLENQVGQKYEWVWGILQASCKRVGQGEVHSYWLGFFDSDLMTYTICRGGVRVVRGPAGAQVIHPFPKTVISKLWVKRKMWRLDFQSGVLLAVERAE